MTESIPALTVGIPTYNRREAVVEAVRSALTATAGRTDVQILVADNASADGTVTALSSAWSDAHVTVVAGERNLGWLGNVTRIAEHARGRFVLLLSDEDDVLGGDALTALIDRMRQDPRPVAITTRRETSRASRRHSSAEAIWESSHYISGNAFETATLRAALRDLRDLDGQHDLSDLLELYPHFMAMLKIWLEGSTVVHLDRAVYGRDRPRLATNFDPSRREGGASNEVRRIIESTGWTVGKAHHRSLPSVLAQQAALARLLVAVEERGASLEMRRRIRSVRAWQASRLARSLDRSVALAFPEIHGALIRGLRNHLFGDAIRRGCRRSGRFSPAVWYRRTR